MGEHTAGNAPLCHSAFPTGRRCTTAVRKLNIPSTRSLAAVHTILSRPVWNTVFRYSTSRIHNRADRLFYNLSPQVLNTLCRTGKSDLHSTSSSLITAPLRVSKFLTKTSGRTHVTPWHITVQNRAGSERPVAVSCDSGQRVAAIVYSFETYPQFSLISPITSSW
jgi:hypothetical protein